MTDTKLTKRLRELQRATDQALKDAYERHLSGKLHCTVNWMDLYCEDAAWVISLEGGEHWRVDIQEADPDNVVLRHFIRQWLDAAGFGDVVVHTEW